MGDFIAKPIVLEGKSFDWSEGSKALENAVNSDGSANWKALTCADPGVCSCPNCGQFSWREGDVQKCTVCSVVFPVEWYSIVQTGQRTKSLQTEHISALDYKFYFWGVHNPDLDYDGVHSKISIDKPWNI